MAAVGDADVAITRQSYVFKYLENKFPAYVVYPKEGTPVNLFCVGLFKNTADDLQGLKVMEWLMTSEQVQAIAQENATGYLSCSRAALTRLLPMQINLAQQQLSGAC